MERGDRPCLSRENLEVVETLSNGRAALAPRESHLTQLQLKTFQMPIVHNDTTSNKKIAGLFEWNP